MFARPVRTAAAVAAAALCPVLALTSSAYADNGGCGGGAGTLTVHVSDATPASGQQFGVRGKVQFFGMSPAGYVVKVQSHDSGSWQPVEGARVVTDNDGRYRLHLVLTRQGERDLRVVSVGRHGEPNMHHRFSVTVS